MRVTKYAIALAGLVSGLVLMLDASGQVDILTGIMDDGIYWGAGATLSFGSFLLMRAA